METTRALAYIRVSTEEQSSSGHSLDAQKTNVMSELERRGWSLVELIEENGSAKSMRRRPGLQRALDRLAAGEADVLVTTKLDRLTRSVADLSKLIALSSAEGWSFVTLDVALDTTSPSGKAMAQMIGVFAEWERDMLSERTKVGMAAAVAKGVKVGRPRKLDARTRRRIARERARGRSYVAIANGLNDDQVERAHGGAAWHASTIRQIALAG